MAPKMKKTTSSAGMGV